jgi:hypothetical protein
LDAPHGCNAASIIIDADGFLYYPCRTLMAKSIDVSKEPLMKFFTSEKANECRGMMSSCNINCHWYQYFATDSFLSLRSSLSSIMPYAADLI